MMKSVSKAVNSLFSDHIYITDEKDSHRFALGITREKNILFIGANPSTATIQKSDTTISKIKGFCAVAGDYGWIVVNIYSQRATDPNDIDITPNQTSIDKNLEIICEIVERYNIAMIIPCWGNLIEFREYFPDILKRLKTLKPLQNVKWYSLGKPTQQGHPRHPSRLGYSIEFEPFDVDKY